MLRKVVDETSRPKILGFIRQLQESLKLSPRTYYSTSLLIIRDKKNTAVRWIDFTYWHEGV